MVDFWWFFHAIILFWKVQFPIHAKQFQYNKCLHAVIVVFALLFPMIPIGVALGTGGYTVTTFPPLNNCFARNPAASFYPFILPKCIIFPIGITFTLITIWKLSRTDVLHSKQVHQHWIIASEYLFYIYLAAIKCKIGIQWSRFFAQDLLNFNNNTEQLLWPASY